MKIGLFVTCLFAVACQPYSLESLYPDAPEIEAEEGGTCASCSTCETKVQNVINVPDSPPPIVNNNIEVPTAPIEVSCPGPVVEVQAPVSVQIDPSQVGSGRSRAVLYIEGYGSDLPGAPRSAIRMMVNGIYDQNNDFCVRPGPRPNTWDYNDCCPPGFTPVGFDDRSSVSFGVRNLICLED